MAEKQKLYRVRNMSPGPRIVHTLDKNGKMRLGPVAIQPGKSADLAIDPEHESITRMVEGGQLSISSADEAQKADETAAKANEKRQAENADREADIAARAAAGGDATDQPHAARKAASRRKR